MRTPQRIALIGYGAVSQAVLRHFAAHQMEVLCVLLRPGWQEKERAEPPRPPRLLAAAVALGRLRGRAALARAGAGARVRRAGCGRAVRRARRERRSRPD